MEQPEVKTGQIWKDQDPRNERFIRVTGVCIDYALIRKVVRNSMEVSGWQFASKSPERIVKLSRFNGKRNGYSYIEE